MTTSLVTGANRGIGREVAVQLAGLGHHVLLGARRPEAAASVAESIGAGGGRSTILPLDIADPSSAAAARTVCEELGGLDVLVNNAAIMYDTWQSAVHPDFEAVREALDTNLFGTWRLTTALAPLISASPHGRIVNVSSGAGALTDMGGHLPAYRISKVGLNALTRMWGVLPRPAAHPLVTGRGSGTSLRLARTAPCATPGTGPRTGRPDRTMRPEQGTTHPPALTLRPPWTTRGCVEAPGSNRAGSPRCVGAARMAHTAAFPRLSMCSGAPTVAPEADLRAALMLMPAMSNVMPASIR